MQKSNLLFAQLINYAWVGKDSFALCMESKNEFALSTNSGLTMYEKFMTHR